MKQTDASTVAWLAKRNRLAISGHRFTGATALTVGGGSVERFDVLSDTRITALVPKRARGTVRVTNAAGTSPVSGYAQLV